MPGCALETVATLVQLVGRFGGKTLVVQDSPGFFLTRVSQCFFNEAMALVGEGVAAAQVEKTALSGGLPSGPLAVLDRVSLKLSDELLHQELHDLEHGAGDHDNDHVHAHAHDHDHEPRHDEAPGGARAHADARGHDHGHGHDHHHHDHDLDHHDHDHAHAHDQVQGDDHVSPGGKHDHQHDHQHDHEHDHQHEHGHDHPHSHGHQHDHGHGRHPAHRHAHQVKSKRMPEPAVYVMEKMAHGFRRMGRDAGAGFYEYEDDGSAALWSGLKAFERRATKLPAEDIQDRLLFIPVLEAIRCLEDGVISSLVEADAALVAMGIFPADLGGTSAFIERLGTRVFVERAQALAARYGERFQPPARLVEAARTSG
jgi:hypothetical protein